jgi:murein DD-endopeptidase MepM/ murein hydrolase activator NlpD
MKYYQFIFLALVIISCGQGVDEVTHKGVCEGYNDQSTSEYDLPFAVNESKEVSQANCSAASHFGPQRFAYDFATDIGTDIYAARAGTVIEVEESFEDGNGCPDDNHVYIRHSDNTIGGYVHLTKNGANVNVGDVVAQGDLIGTSGNTGCSSGAHLHFHVWQSDAKENTIPVVFRNTSANPRGLAGGKTYTAQ